jgi:hypothetical protein
VEERATHVLKVPREVLEGALVVIPPDQDLSPVEALQNGKARTWDYHIPKVIDRVTLVDHPVPVINHMLVHLFDRIEGSQVLTIRPDKSQAF